MRIFEINAVGQHALPVFARSYDEAVGIYILHWTTNRRTGVPDFEVKQRNPSWPGLNRELLADALGRGVAGIGRLHPDQGWVILPADQRDEVQA